MDRYNFPSMTYLPLYKTMLEGGHHLIAGTTGSGKSVLLNGILHTALALYTPDEANFVLIDPKMVELYPYKKLPHTVRYADDPQRTLEIFQEASKIMARRYESMRSRGDKTYNGKTIYIIIDEFADLISGNGLLSVEIEKELTHLLRLGRAAKVFIFAATQDPSRRTVKAQLVHNFPNRVALRCLSAIESRQIIGQAGAEKLPRYGEFYYLTPDGIEHYHGMPLVPDSEINERINFWVHNKPIY